MTKYYWWENGQDTPGDNPFLSGGGGGSNPFLPAQARGGSVQQSLTTAQHEGQNLGLKERALGMSSIGQPSVWSKAGQGALGALHWLFTPIRKGTNALSGGLEEMRSFNSAEGTNQGAAKGWSDPLGEIRALGQGLSKGWKENQQYSMGRYIGNASSDITGSKRGSGFAPLRFLEALGTDRNEQLGQTPWQYAQTAYGPSPDGTPLSQRIKNSTLSDLLGFYVENKLAEKAIPVRMGRETIPGKATGIANPAKYRLVNMGERTLDQVMNAAKKNPLDDILGVNNVNQARKVVQSEFGVSASEARKLGDRGLFQMAQDVIEARPLPSPVTRVTREAGKRGFQSLDDLFNFAAKSPTEQFRQLGSRANMRSGFFGIPDEAQTLVRSLSGAPATFAPDELRRVMQVLTPMGWKTPALEAQLRFGDKLASAGRSTLGMLPQGAQDALGAVFRNMETDKTPQLRAMNEAIDTTKQGARTGIRNTEERLFQAIDQLAPGITDNERRALYYAIGMGKDLTDPEFLATLSRQLDIPATELQNLSRLQGFRDFIEGEFKGFKAKGEAKGLFKGVEDPYVPIFHKGINLGGEVGTNQALRQQMGGLRSIQKLRTTDVETLLNRSEQITDDDIISALMRYNRTFHNIERTRNLTDILQQLGIVSKQRQAGFDTLADAISFGSAGKQAERLYINEAYKGRLANEMLGFLRDSPLGRGLRKVEDYTRPWKTVATTLNPAYHLRNTIDDFVRTNIMGEGKMDDYAKAVTRETGEASYRGVRVQDWSKNARGQWEYTPGMDSRVDLTPEDAKNLARAMGVSRTQLDAVGANTNLMQRLRVAAKDKTGLDIFKDPGSASREAYFLSGLRNTGNANLAKKLVGNDLIDYGDVSPFIRDVVRPLAPFSTFAFKNPAVALESTLRNPGRLAQFDQLRNAAAQGDQSLYENLPEFLRDQGVVAYRDGNGQVQVFNPGLSQFDWQNFAPAKGMKMASRLPHPVIQAVLGLQRGVDAYGIPIDTAEGYGKKQVKDPLAALLIGRQGQDGGQYADATTKFLYDTFMSGPSAMSTAFSDPSSFLFRGMSKQYDEQELLLQALLDQNRLRQGRLKGFQQTGGQVPSVQTLRSNAVNPFLSR